MGKLPPEACPSGVHMGNHGFNVVRAITRVFGARTKASGGPLETPCPTITPSPRRAASRMSPAAECCRVFWASSWPCWSPQSAVRGGRTVPLSNTGSSAGWTRSPRRNRAAGVSRSSSSSHLRCLPRTPIAEERDVNLLHHGGSGRSTFAAEPWKAPVMKNANIRKGWLPVGKCSEDSRDSIVIVSSSGNLV